MTNLLMTYDVEKKPEGIHTLLKNYLKEKYYWKDKILSSKDKWYELPNTTLIKSGANLTKEQGGEEFIAACKAVGAKWEKYICVDRNSATFDNQ